MENLGRVVLINGQEDADNQVFVVKAHGDRALLQLNDALTSGDTVITPKGIAIDVQLANGELIHIPANQAVKVTSDIAGDTMADADDSAVNQSTVKTVIQAIDVNRDYIEVLEDVEEGLISGNGFGSLFKIIQDHNLFQTMFDQEHQLTMAGDSNNNADNTASIVPINSRANVLDLRDLLTDDVQVDNLAAYLHFEVVGDDTVVQVDSSGGFSGGVAPHDVQTITIAGVDLVSGLDSDNLVIENLLANNKLIID